jgi:hypothetical protein
MVRRGCGELLNLILGADSKRRDLFAATDTTDPLFSSMGLLELQIQSVRLTQLMNN